MPGDSYDVVIVGSGPAGCAAALTLPQGTRTLLIDRSRPGAAKCCGGLLTPESQKALTALGLQLPAGLRVKPEPRSVRAFDLDCGRGQSYRRDYVNLDRDRFDAWLLALAGERVEFSPQTRFVGVGPEPGEVRFRRGDLDQEVECRLVIGADGPGSTVRRVCHAGRPGPATMTALQAVLACPAPNCQEPVHEVLFGSALTDYYAWAIPKRDTLLIGCAFEDSEGAKQRFEQVIGWFRERLSLQGEVLERSAKTLSRPRSRAELFAGAGRVLLAGEAAGLVSPSSGEGISFALLSGAAAGRAAASAAPTKAYKKSFDPLARQIMAKTAKARVIYSPRLRSLALRLPWYP